MKHSKTKFFLLILIFGHFISCSSNDVQDEENNNSNNTVTATINGSAFKGSFDVNLATILQGGTTETLTITASHEDLPDNGFSISLLIYHRKGDILNEGIYTYKKDCEFLSEFCSDIMMLKYENQNFTDQCAPVYNENTEFQIGITSIDYKIGGHVIGDFSGVISCDSGEDVKIENGKFNLEIIKL